jgi:hypothetical protein
MTDPITPPPELVQQWIDLSLSEEERLITAYRVGADQQLRLDAEQIEKAYQAGADQELEACCAELESIPSPLGIPFGKMAGNALRAARRPKSPSLKERALHELAAVYNRDEIDDSAYDAIRLALEALPDD